jgi:hypothetical protein
LGNTFPHRPDDEPGEFLSAAQNWSAGEPLSLNSPNMFS